MKIRTLAAMTVPLLVGLAACGEDDAAGPDPQVDAGGSSSSGAAPPDAAAPEPLAWAPCTAPFTGDCALASLPLDHANPAGKTIDVFVTRFVDPPNARGALWLLQGGPGGSVARYEEAIAAYTARFPDLTIYGLEHRGVGRSGRLACAGNDCGGTLAATLGPDLAFYSTTMAAHDLHEVITRTRRAAEPVFVFGNSYGTYLAQRHLALYPAEPAGVVLDSVVPPDGNYFSGFEEHGELAAKEWAALCEADALCTSKYGPGAWDKFRSYLAEVDVGHCPASGLTRDRLVYLRALMDNNALAMVQWPIVWRYHRCTPQDAAFVANALQKIEVNYGFGPADQLDSEGMYRHVAFSEIWEAPAPSATELAARFDRALLPADFVRQYGALQATWPVYPRDEWVGRYPDTSVPVLVLNGTLDPQTPLAHAALVKPHYTKPGQTFVTIPQGNHGVAIALRTAENTCGLEIMAQFLRNPSATPDTSCTTTIPPISFAGDPATNLATVDTEDLWEGAIGSPVPPSPPAQRLIEQARARRSFFGAPTHGVGP